ncbi:hypothetical protein ACFPK1_29445 [Actinomycetospora rhizophila]|uniref:Uncharacterized protein n=1 Tax=Actinomycetospora rhizophila TaxID=1416876 RepID=A0ABV9ZPF8_9PSEU
MTATTTCDDRPPGGGPAPRWSPRRLGHHRYLWWAGALVLAAVAVGIAIGLDTSPGPGLTDGGALAVLVAVCLLAPVLVWMTGLELVTAVRRRVRDDVRDYGTGQAARGAAPAAVPGERPWPRPAEEVLLHVDVDHVADAARVVERAVPHGRHRWIETGREDLRLRSGRGTLLATGPDGLVRHRATRRARPGHHRARWDLELDGRHLAFEVHGLQPVPRRTLLEPDGTAWLVQMGTPSLLDQLRGGRAARLRPHGRLPEDLAPDAVAFCLWLFCELETHQDRVRSYGREYGAATPEPVADAWTGHDTTATPMQEARP